MENKNRTKISRQPIQVPSGWVVQINKFCDVDPERIDELEGYTFDEKWLYLENELLVCEYQKNGTKWTLDMGWSPEYDPDGEYILLLVKNDDWRNIETVKETRAITKIVQAVNETMLRLSQENRDFVVESGDAQLQALRPLHGWRFVKNEFFEIDPSSDITSNEWRLFHESLLRLEAWNDSKYRIEMGWFPSHNPYGLYVAKLINEDLEKPLLEEFSTKERAEIVEYVNEAMAGRMSELSNKRERSERERRRQQRLSEQRA